MSQAAWELKGRIQQLIYSPKGGLEGFLLDVGGVPVQFVCQENDAANATLQVGQALTAIGRERPASDKGEAAHEVYDFVEWVQAPKAKAAKANNAPHTVRGKVVRFNYAKHGEANGVILDSGHFIHTKPEGLQRLGWKIGQRVEVPAPARRPLFDGSGTVIDFKG